MSFSPDLSTHDPNWITNPHGVPGNAFCSRCGISRGRYAAAHPVKVETLPAGFGTTFLKAAK